MEKICQIALDFAGSSYCGRQWNNKQGLCQVQKKNGRCCRKNIWKYSIATIRRRTVIIYWWVFYIQGKRIFYLWFDDLPHILYRILKVCNDCKIIDLSMCHSTEKHFIRKKWTGLIWNRDAKWSHNRKYIAKAIWETGERPAEFSRPNQEIKTQITRRGSSRFTLKDWKHTLLQIIF